MPCSYSGFISRSQAAWLPSRYSDSFHFHIQRRKEKEGRGDIVCGCYLWYLLVHYLPDIKFHNKISADVVSKTAKNLKHRRTLVLKE